MGPQRTGEPSIGAAKAMNIHEGRVLPAPLPQGCILPSRCRLGEFVCLVFLIWILLCALGYPETHLVSQAGQICGNSSCLGPTEGWDYRCEPYLDCTDVFVIVRP